MKRAASPSENEAVAQRLKKEAAAAAPAPAPAKDNGEVPEGFMKLTEGSASMLYECRAEDTKTRGKGKDDGPVFYNKVQVFNNIGATNADELSSWADDDGDVLLLYNNGPSTLHYTALYDKMGDYMYSENNRTWVDMSELTEDYSQTTDGRARVPYVYCSHGRSNLGDSCLTRDYGAAEPRTLWQGFGLSQHGEMSLAANAAYSDALEQMMRPRMILHLENTIPQRVADDDTAGVYRALKVYLLLGGQQEGRGDDESIKAFFEEVWGTEFSSIGQQVQRDQLNAHLAAMLLFLSSLFFIAKSKLGLQAVWKGLFAFQLVRLITFATRLRMGGLAWRRADVE